MFKGCAACADPESFFQRGPTLTMLFFVDVFFFLFDKGQGTTINTTINRPLTPSPPPPPPFHWRTDGGPTLNSALVALAL